MESVQSGSGGIGLDFVMEMNSKGQIARVQMNDLCGSITQWDRRI